MTEFNKPFPELKIKKSKAAAARIFAEIAYLFVCIVRIAVYFTVGRFGKYAGKSVCDGASRAFTGRSYA